MPIPGPFPLDSALLAERSVQVLNVKAYGATGDGVTDDTAAIQAAIDYAVTLGAATIYFPAGVYLCNGALQGTLGGSEFFSVLRIPAINGNEGWASIEFRGPTPCALYGFGSISMGTDNTPVQGAVIKSTGDNGWVIGAEPGLVGGAGFCAVSVAFQNIEVVTKDDPTRGGICGYYFLQIRVLDSMVHTGKYGNAASEPTTVGVTGIRFPRNFNATLQVAERSAVAGYYNGWWFSELATGTDLIAYHCKEAWAMDAGDLSHALHFGRICDSACEIGISVKSRTFVNIDQWDRERAVSSWYANVADIDSAGGTLQGSANYHHTTALTGVPNDTTTFINGSPDYFSMTMIGGRPRLVLNCSGTTQSLANNSYVPVQWQVSVDGDDSKGFTWSPGDSSIQIDNPGLYSIEANVGFATNSTGFRTLYVNDSRTFNTVFQGAMVPGQAGEETVASVSYTGWFAAGNSISIIARQTSGGPLDVENAGAQSYFSKLVITKVG